MKRIAFILVLLGLTLFPAAVRADVAPPIFPPGSSLQPGSEGTQVRMVSETVLVDVRDDGSLGRANITADFMMRNLGTEAEKMAARFPISANDGRGSYPEISDLVITIAGHAVQYRRVSYPDVRYGDELVPWAEFDVTFPPGVDMPIQVRYKLDGSGYAPYTAFYYILETGAGWRDTIGSAEVILRLPYEASPQNVVLDAQVGWAQTTTGGQFSGNEVRWQFDELEPGPEGAVQNMEFALVAPSAWNAFLKARDAAAKNPTDDEVWGQLGKAYKSIFFMGKFYREDQGGQELYRLSVEAYEKCLELDPGDAQWRAGFADLLAQRAYWDSWVSGLTPDAYRAFEEIRTALELAPDDPVVLQVAESIYFMFPDGITQTDRAYDFLWLTQTPTALPPVPTDVTPFVTLPAPTAQPSATAIPLQVQDTPVPQPAAQPSSPSLPCGAAALAQLAVLMLASRKRKA